MRTLMGPPRRSQCFIAHLPAPLRASADPLQLEAILEDSLEQARARWPSVQLEPEVFVAHVACKVTGDVAAALASLHTADLYLAAACASGNAEALRVFETTWFGDPNVMPPSKQPSAGDELRAVLRERLFVATAERRPRISDYSGKGPLKNWLKVAAARAGLNLARSDVPAADEAVLDRLPLPDDGPELGHMKRLYRAEFSAAFSEALATLSVRSRTLLKLRYVDGLTVAQVAALYQVHVVTIARWQAKAIASVLGRVRGALMTRLSVDPGELDSILRLVRSGVEVTLGSLLRSPQPQ